MIKKLWRAEETYVDVLFCLLLQDLDKALLVLAGQWECSYGGAWDFVVDKHSLSHCVMVDKKMGYERLKRHIEHAFEVDVRGRVRQLSYWAPSELSIFATHKTPPVSVASDEELEVFFQVRAATRGLNLLVSFETRWDEEPLDSGTLQNVSSTACHEGIICIADPTPSLYSSSVDPTTEGYRLNDDVEAVSGPEIQNTVDPVYNPGMQGVDLNTIYDSELVAHVEAIEALQRDAERVRKERGKEKVASEAVRIGVDEGSSQYAAFGSEEEDHGEQQRVWNALVGAEYTVTASRSYNVGGEASNYLRSSSVDNNADHVTSGLVISEIDINEEAAVDVEAENGMDGDYIGGGGELDEAIQLSLATMYTDIVEAEFVPTLDCPPCFGDEFLRMDHNHVGIFDPSNDAIYIGRLFNSKAEMQTALAIYAIKRFFNFKQTRSDKDRLIVVCVDPKCAWRVYGHTPGGTSKSMEVRTATLTHTCDVTTRAEYGKKASCKVIAEVLKSKYANGRLGPRAIDVPDIVLDELRVSINYMRAWHGRERAVAAARGSDEGSYKLLMTYLHLLSTTNPGSVYDVVTHREGTGSFKFKYLFFAIGACIHAVQFMRRVVIIDATTIKAKFRGCLLTASFQDGNFQIMPLGFGVVDRENDAAWSWFFTQMLKIIPDSEDLVFVSDRHTAIYSALRTVYPLAQHGACAVHLYRNVKSRFRRHKGLAHLVSKAACAYTVGEFRRHFDEIERRSPLCANYLRGIGISHWTRVYFMGKRYHLMSSNVAESLNAALAKALEFPIVSMVETIRMMIMRWFNCRRNMANNNQGPVTPEVENILMKNLTEAAGLSVTPASLSIFQVNTTEGTFTVDIGRKTCTCKVFETLGIPCKHALAAARHYGQSISDGVEEYYKADAWKCSYSSVVMPVPNICDETVSVDMANSDIQPPQSSQGPGRPRKRRIPSAGESSVYITSDPCLNLFIPNWSW